jgi:hypothetical protein
VVVAVISIAGLTVALVEIWKKNVTRWVMVLVLVFCVLTTADRVFSSGLNFNWGSIYASMASSQRLKTSMSGK